ncbi:MAG: hypothetical protein JNL39_10515 [Opitutaceae bacterium]|nr:hypothetical protein [Opitutaceae bacterium]
MPTLSFHASEPMSRRLRQRARAAKLPLSAYLAVTVERGLEHEPPKVALGALAGTAALADNYDPVAPVIPARDWKR